MRARLAVVVMLVGVLPVGAAAPSDADVLAAAQAAFERGMENKSRLLVAPKHFAEAADAYRELHRRGVRSPGLYLSLGNAAVLADRWPEAIWAYQMGLALDPNHAGLRENLAFVRAKVIYPPDGRGRLDPGSWPAWFPRLTAFHLVLLFSLSYLLACVGITVAILRQPSRDAALTNAWNVFAWVDVPFAIVIHQPRVFAATALAILLAAASGLGLGQAMDQAESDRRTPAVVVVDNIPILRGNGPSYPPHPDLAFLPRGLEARQLHRRGTWLQIRLSTGEVGWVHQTQVLVVQ